MKIRLQITVAPDTSLAFEHAGPSVRIGRAPECELRFPAEANQVSGTHARLDLSPEGAWLLDLNSTNGTFVNDRRLDGPQRLQVADRIQLGFTGPTLTVVGIDASPVPVAVGETASPGTEWSSLLTAAPEEPHAPAVAPSPARPNAKGRWLFGVILGAALHLAAVALVLYWIFGRPARTVPDTRPIRRASPRNWGCPWPPCTSPSPRCSAACG